jgi:class 3 adenylate cyclase/predicted ATPase
MTLDLQGAAMQQIVEWLQTLGLGQYAHSFAENDITFAILPDLTDQDLEKIGVASLGHRRQLMRAISELKSAPEPATVAATPIAPHDAAERRQVTVMFSDLVGSTALSARMDPEDLREVIAAYQKCVADTVRRFGGFVAKYMGDGVLVYFGYPEAHEDDAERAVRAGLEGITAVRALKLSVPLQIRVGIATGLVVVGDLIGSGEAQERGIVGETPNLAARLQALAEAGEVVISQSTHRLTSGMFEYRDLGRIAVKGLAAPVQSWQVLGASAVESRFEAQHATALTPLVGREEELELLLRRWQQAKAGDGCVVLVSGEPGIGKSRIVLELLEHLRAEGYTRLRQYCSPHHQDTALYPTLAQIERAAGFHRDDAGQQRLAKLEEVLAQATNDLSEATPLLAALLSIPTNGRYPPLNLTPQKRKEKTLKALVAQVEGLAARNPVLMAVEDAHWIDPTSLELLDRTIDRVSTLPVLVIVTFRPEFAPPWMGRPHVTLLNLDRLPSRQRAEMIDRVTCGKRLPKEIADHIIDRTDGVPLFIEELTKAVVESGIVQEVESEYAVTGPVSSLSIPTSLHASLLARLDRLAPVREVAQLGATIGRQFSHELISAVAAMPQSQLDDSLAQLVRAELIFRNGMPPDAEYTFKHALVRDAAYSTLLRSRRQQFHARIAATLEAQFPEVEPELLAYHYTEAGRLEQAADYWLKAGQRAMQRSAHVEAERHLRKGLKVLAGLPETASRFTREIAVQNTLGVCLMPTRGFGNPEVDAAFTRAADLSERSNDDRGLFVSLRGRGQYHFVSGDVRTARDNVPRVLALAERMGDHDWLIEAHHLGWSTFCFAGEFRASHRHAEEGMARYQRGRDHHLTYGYSGHDPGVCCRMFGAMTLGQLGYSERALALCAEGLTLAETIAHPFTLAIALWNSAILHQLLREPNATGTVGERLVHYSNEMGLRSMVPVGKCFRGDALTHQSELAEGIAQMREGIAELRSTGTLVALPSVCGALADALARYGNVDEALTAVQEGLTMARVGGDRYSLPEIHRMNGQLLLARSAADEDAAEAAYHEALAVARGQHARLLELRTSTSLARLWRDQGKRTEARDLLAPIYGWFTEGFDTLDLKQAKALLDELA